MNQHEERQYACIIGFVVVINSKDGGRTVKFPSLIPQITSDFPWYEVDLCVSEYGLIF